MSVGTARTSLRDALASKIPVEVRQSYFDYFGSFRLTSATLGDATRSLLPRRGTLNTSHSVQVRSVQVSDHRKHRSAFTVGVGI
ncbi:MAG: hypothetical protein V7K40_24585 [Nostoc sp.]|uniref:hypothetical protein n=1 Tax=Nostoc sp. TaxID=1180 RepID=UPI002FF7FD57